MRQTGEYFPKIEKVRPVKPCSPPSEGSAPGSQSVCGVSMLDFDRFKVKDESKESNNGIREVDI